MCGQNTRKSALVARHNELVDILWEWRQPTTLFPDPVKHFPIETVERIFSFVVYQVENLESGANWWK